jgi:hypothetical protein
LCHHMSPHHLQLVSSRLHVTAYQFIGQCCTRNALQCITMHSDAAMTLAEKCKNADLAPPIMSISPPATNTKHGSEHLRPIVEEHEADWQEPTPEQRRAQPAPVVVLPQRFQSLEWRQCARSLHMVQDMCQHEMASCRMVPTAVTGSLLPLETRLLSRPPLETTRLLMHLTHGN